MKAERAIPAILIGCLVLVFALGLWILGRSQPPKRRPAAPARVTAAADATLVPTAGRAVRTASGVRHRLAGTVVGDARYAVIEGPRGESDLYRPGQTVPGLGRLVEVDADRATFDGEDGRVELRLAAAPTLTPAPSPLATLAPSGSPNPPAPRPESARTPPATPPSAEPGRSAS